MIKTLLFDIGGTLLTVHNSPELRTAFGETLKKRLALYGLPLEVSAEQLGLQIHENGELYKHWAEEHKAELPQARIWSDFYLREYHFSEEQLAPYAEELSFRFDYDRVELKRRPDVYEALTRLHDMGIRLGIITNVQSTSFAPHILKEYGIDKLMDCLVMSSEAGCRKPDPAIFRLAMDQLGVTPEETGYVGDTISRDVLGSRNAGLGLVVQIRNPKVAHRDAAFLGRPDCPVPDYLIDELSELIPILEAVNAQP